MKLNSRRKKRTLKDLRRVRRLANTASRPDDGFVYVRIKRGEDYEDVAPEIVMFDMIENPKAWEIELIESPASRDDELRALRESLEWALDSMCHHNATRPGSGREWCLHCSAWIYPSDKEMRAKADQLVTLKDQGR